MNKLVQQELSRLSKKDIDLMRHDYHQTSYYSLRDIACKYAVSIATACHVVKSDRYKEPISF